MSLSDVHCDHQHEVAVGIYFPQSRRAKFAFLPRGSDEEGLHRIETLGFSQVNIIMQGEYCSSMRPLTECKSPGLRVFQRMVSRNYGGRCI
jgi:hypothetical protein